MREKLAKLKSKVRVKDPPNTGVILDAYTERDGKELRIYTRSHVLLRQLPAWMSRERSYTIEGETMTVDGWWAVQQHYPGVETFTVFGPAEDLETTNSDRMFRQAAEDPTVQQVMKVLGGVLVDVRPDRQKRGKKDAKTD